MEDQKGHIFKIDASGIKLFMRLLFHIQFCNFLKNVSRTDSETTDDQCIPESTSEPHDSALDSMDDYIDDENLKIDDNINNVNNVDNFNNVDDFCNKNDDFCPKVPQICLLEVQSSTESDKTVLSTTTVFEQQLRALNSDCSLPSSPGLICSASGNLWMNELTI